MIEEQDGPDWHAAEVDRAGKSVIGQRSPVADSLPVAEMVARYAGGMTIRSLVTEYGASYGTVHRVLRLNGAEFRRSRSGTREDGR